MTSATEPLLRCEVKRFSPPNTPVPTILDEAAARLQQDYHLRVSRRILQNILAQSADA